MPSSITFLKTGSLNEPEGCHSAQLTDQQSLVICLSPPTPNNGVSGMQTQLALYVGAMGFEPRSSSLQSKYPIPPSHLHIK